MDDLTNRFSRLGRAVAAVGFGLGALAFYVISLQPVAPASFTVLAVLHALGGLGVGGALTFTVAGKPLEVVGYTVAGRFEPGTVRLLDANGRDVPFASAGSATSHNAFSELSLVAPNCCAAVAMGFPKA